ncbi:MAG: nitroreductase [Xanthomonadales bacterium]|nr:nitroreductase [Xanthomonadales bacterium]
MSSSLVLSGSELAGFADQIRARRTINFFEPDPVPRELVTNAVELARWAPNHRVTEPWLFHLLGTRLIGKVIDLAVELALREKGEEAAAARRQRMEQVPGWLVVSCRVSQDALLDREDYAATCCAVQNLMLYLWQAGVGVKWTTGPVTRDPRLLESLGLAPDQYRCVGLFWYGYPRIVPQQKRKDLSQVLVETD